MDRSRWELPDGLVLDARRAVWIPPESTLAVADLHLGYAWAHRHNGQMLPLSAPNDTVPRLHALLDDYKPRTLVLLGDIVHRAVSLKPLKDELCRVFSELGRRTELKLVAGNHDRALDRLLRECEIGADLHRELQAGPHLLVHGDADSTAKALPIGGRRIIGHEHPAITVSDSVATSTKVPCFVIAPALLILPAFSRWAAGGSVHFQAGEIIAILGEKLLPLRR